MSTEDSYAVKPPPGASRLMELAQRAVDSPAIPLAPHEIDALPDSERVWATLALLAEYAEYAAANNYVEMVTEKLTSGADQPVL